MLHDLGAHDAPVIVPYDHQGSDIEHGALNGPALARIRWSSTARLRSTVTWRAGLLPSHAEEARPPHGLDVVEGISGQDLQVHLGARWALGESCHAREHRVLGVASDDDRALAN